MRTSFGQFTRKPPVPRYPDLKHAERQIVRAFTQGEAAGRADEPRSVCPYAPFSDADKFAAWQCGYAEHAVRYVLADKPQSEAA